MISTFFYRNPRLLIMALVLVIATGIAAFYNSPRLEDPVLSRRVAVVSISYPGADTDRVDSLVTTKIEQAIRSIAEIKTIQSRSRPGVSLIKVELRDSVSNIPEVWSRVRDKIEQSKSDLPAQALSPEIRIAEMKSYAAMVALSTKSDGPADAFTLRRIAIDLQARIDRLGGTETTRIFGDPGEEAVVEVDLDNLASTGLTVGALGQQIEQSQPRFPAGTLKQNQIERPITYGDKFDSLAGLRETLIQPASGGEPVKLSGLANVSIQTESNPINATLIDGQEAIVICAYVRDDYRVDLWSDRLDRLLLNVKKQLPKNVELSVIFSQRPFVALRMQELLSNLLLGMIAVMIVIIVMMDWRSATVIGLALPLTALIVLAGLRILKIPIHQMSITGIVIALGLLIDNAIVIVDECRQRMHSGLSISTAIAQAVHHLAMPLLCSTLTTTLAFLPIAMLPGPPGEFVGTIAVSVILAINASLLLALTVVPSLFGMISRETVQNAQHAKQVTGLSIPLFSKMYQRSLSIVCQHPLLGLLVGIGLPVLGFIQTSQLPEQFFPASDRNQIQIEVELPVGTSQEQTRNVITSLNDLIRNEAGVRHTNWFIGESAPSFYYNIVPRRQHATYYAQAFIDLEPGMNTPRFVRELQTKLTQSNRDARILVRQLEQGPPVDAPIEILLKGPDLRVLEQLGSELRKILSKTPDVINTRSDLGEVTTSLELDFEKDKLNAAGLTQSDVASQLYTTIEGIEAGTIWHREFEIPVIVRITDADEMDLDELQGLIIQPTGPRMNARGEIMDSEGPPLSAVSDFRLDADISTITRIDGEYTNELKAYITAGKLPAVVLADFRSRLKQSSFKLPTGYTIDFAGETAARNEAVTNLIADAVILISLMVSILVISFRSFRIAFIIASVAGLAVGLGPAALWYFGYPFGFMAILGTMGLMGLAVNDSIVVMAGIRADPDASRGDVAAIVNVVNGCTRHVLSTTFTTIAGFLPLILSGGDFWPPLAITVAGGVGGATLLALYFVPAAYVICRDPKYNTSHTT